MSDRPNTPTLDRVMSPADMKRLSDAELRRQKVHQPVAGEIGSDQFADNGQFFIVQF